jgi:hypothetical protein
MTLEEFRQGLREKRELAEQRAARKAELEALTPEERKAEFRKGDAEAHIPPPTAGDPDFERLVRQIEMLPPEKRAEAYEKAHITYEKRVEAQRAEHAARVKQAEMASRERQAQYAAYGSRVGLELEQQQQWLLNSFPELQYVDTHPQWWAEFQQQNPERAMMALAAEAQSRRAMDAAHAAQQQQQQAAFESDLAQAAMGDAQFDQRMRANDPDIYAADGSYRPELKQGFINYFSRFGFDRGTVEHALKTNAKVPVRSAFFQEMAIDAVRFRMAQAKAAEAKRAPLPPVQRPGEPGGRPAFGEAAEIERLESKGALSQKEGAKLIGLRMKARRA